MFRVDSDTENYDVNVQRWRQSVGSQSIPRSQVERDELLASFGAKIEEADQVRRDDLGAGDGENAITGVDPPDESYQQSRDDRGAGEGENPVAGTKPPDGTNWPTASSYVSSDNGDDGPHHESESVHERRDGAHWEAFATSPDKSSLIWEVEIEGTPPRCPLKTGNALRTPKHCPYEEAQRVLEQRRELELELKHVGERAKDDVSIDHEHINANKKNRPELRVVP
jgi:hypothetical protein